jgi:hypothetical protein
MRSEKEEGRKKGEKYGLYGLTFPFYDNNSTAYCQLSFVQ